MWSSAAQRRFTPPAKRTIESARVAPLFHDWNGAVAPGADWSAPAIMIDQGDGCCCSGERGVPPRPGWRTKTISRPLSRDQIGSSIA